MVNLLISMPLANFRLPRHVFCGLGTGSFGNLLRRAGCFNMRGHTVHGDQLDTLRAPPDRETLPELPSAPRLSTCFPSFTRERRGAKVKIWLNSDSPAQSRVFAVDNAEPRG